MLESFQLQAFQECKCIKIKRDSNTGFFVKFSSTYFEVHLRATASKLLFREKPHSLNKMRFIDIANTFQKDRSSRPKLPFKNAAYKKFTKFTIKQLRRSLVLKKAARRRVINERFLHRYFPVSVTKFLRTPILKNLCKWLLTV